MLLAREAEHALLESRMLMERFDLAARRWRGWEKAEIYIKQTNTVSLLFRLMISGGRNSASWKGPPCGKDRPCISSGMGKEGAEKEAGGRSLSTNHISLRPRRRPATLCSYMPKLTNLQNICYGYIQLLLKDKKGLFSLWGMSRPECRKQPWLLVLLLCFVTAHRMPALVCVCFF